MIHRALALTALAGALAACGAPTARLRVVVDGDGFTSPAAGTYTYDVGSTLRVTAHPADGATFTRWTGAAEGIVNPVELLVDGDVTLVAHFSPATAGGVSATSHGDARPPGVNGDEIATRGR